MSDAESRIQARKGKLLKAAGIIKKYLNCPDELKGLKVSNEAMLRMGLREDCVFEVAVLINDVIEWLEDDSYYDEIAWELEGKPDV